MTGRRTFLLDSLILICLTGILILPLFRLEYLNNWKSIDSTFIADARMLSEHLPHPAWQPLWYCGTRTDYIYPPALRYGTAFLALAGHVSFARAYHLYTALFYVFGIAAVYWLVRIGSGSRWAAWLAAAATALLSPSFLLLKDVRHDSIYWVPQRLHALAEWGEGPHISSLCVLPAALAAAFAALRKNRPAVLALAGTLAALVVATNFYGATALALLYPIAVWSVWNGERNSGVLWRAAAIPLIAYGLCAFWLTPSYVRITLLNLKWVAQPPESGARIVFIAILAVYWFLSRRFTRGNAGREWRVFVIGAAVALSVYVLGDRLLGLRVTGDPVRLDPELDLALILAGVEVLRELWIRPQLRVVAAVLGVLAFLPGLRYVRHAWFPFPQSAPIANVYEYKTTQWVHDRLPGERVMPSGSIRYWFDAWADNAQPDGGSAQGMLNQIIPVASWQIQHGDRADLAIQWLQALGADAVVVPDKTSFEVYHDYTKPEKFRDAAPVLYDDGHGTVIYGVPRVHPGIVRVVDSAGMVKIGAIRGGDDADTLRRYLDLVEDPARSGATLTWQGSDQAEVRARVIPGESILVQETFDPAWTAWEDGRKLPIRPEPVMGFMLIDAPEGYHDIQLRFETPLENRVGEVLFFVTVIVLAGLIVRGVRAARVGDKRST